MITKDDCQSCGACCTLDVWLDSMEVDHFEESPSLKKLMVIKSDYKYSEAYNDLVTYDVLKTGRS